MKPARLIVLLIAIAAGGVAALLAGRSDQPPPPPEPVAQLETAEVLVANAEIGMGNTVSGPARTCGGKRGRRRPQELASFARATGRTP